MSRPPNIEHIYAGAVISNQLRRLGLKQSRVARDMCIDGSIIHLWSKDKRPVPELRVDALAEALRMDVDDFLDQVRNGVRRPVVPPLLPRVDASVTHLWEESPTVPEDLSPAAQFPEQERLWWCESDHGTGVPRRHHHGPLPSWAPGNLELDWAPTALTVTRERLAAVPQPDWNAVPLRDERITISLDDDNVVKTSRCTVCGVVRPSSGTGFQMHQLSEAHVRAMLQ